MGGRVPLPGYAAIAAALAGIVRARRAGRDAGSLSASIVVGTGAVLIAWSFLVVPTLARRAPAFWLLLTAIALVFVGDVGYATSIIGLASPPAAALDGRSSSRTARWQLRSCTRPSSYSPRPSRCVCGRCCVAGW
ncbi:MAG TPA: hypothetical protein VEZ46_14270 [Mycobacteriales bacterium]|nr:hypothetical protein [Mycobacteriales bacterium]